MFQLEFHLKFFVFRPSDCTEATAYEARSVESVHKWTDLSFLESIASKVNAKRKYGMSEAHFSFVICGWHERRWTAYAFDDTEFDGEDLYERIYNYDSFQRDPFAPNTEIDADTPIWNPRQYFLAIVEARMAQAVVSWETLLRVVERRIRGYVRCTATLTTTFHFLTNGVRREKYILRLYHTKDGHEKKQSRPSTGFDKP